MTTSLLISIYNWPRALELCLESVMRQTVMPTEILIADDGSKKPTADVVRHFTAISPVPIQYIWHEDTGFHLATIRNKAIAASQCDYIIQVDGDQVLERHFIEDHIAFARKGRFITGSRGMLTESSTQDVLSGKKTSISALKSSMTCRNNAIRSPFLACLYRILGPIRYAKGCNMGFWRDDLIRVNGYNEAFVGWGAEDSELAVRLSNSNVRQCSMKFRGILFHFHHNQADRNNRGNNTQIYLNTIQDRLTRCECGLDQHLSPECIQAIRAASQHIFSDN